MEFSRTLAVLQQGLDEQLHIGAQLYISQNGQPLLDAAVGQALPGLPMQTDTLMLWLSAGKPLTAVAIAKLWEQGKLHWDDPVALYLPAFAQNGKSAITIRHLLTHTAGLRKLYPGPANTPWKETIARLCAGPMEPDWLPGTKAAYHPFTTWPLLGEIIERIDGRYCADYIRQEICLPLEMTDTFLALKPEQYASYADAARLGQLMVTAHGRNAPSELDSPEKAQFCRPASSARGPIRQLGFFYEMLLNAGQRTPTSHRVLHPLTVQEITRRQRHDMVDQTFKTKIDWGLGFMLNSAHHAAPIPGITNANEHPYGFGPYAGKEAFGHGGSQSSIGMADPAHGLVIAALFNGCPGEPTHDRRNKAFFRAVYEDLGLK